MSTIRTTRAAVLTRFGQPMEIATLELAEPREGEVCVAIKATGVCHSDLSTALGKLPHDLPCVLGHEAAGVVEAVGPGVRSVRPGDHVVIMFKPMCGVCFYCAGGQRHLCESVRSLGLMDDGTSRLSVAGRVVYHGMNTATFAERAILRASAVVKIDEGVPFEVAAVAGCAVLTGVGAVLSTARVAPGQAVAVIGCGGVGMNVIQGARLSGASPIIAVDTHASKLELARRFGATHVVDASSTDCVGAVRDLTAGRGADVVFEVVGSPALQRAAIDMARPGGAAVFVGLCGAGEDLCLPTFMFAIQEKRILGCFYGSSNPARDLPRVFALWRAGRLDLDGLVSRRVGLDGINDALQSLQAGVGLRTVIVP